MPDPGHGAVTARLVAFSLVYTMAGPALADTTCRERPACMERMTSKCGGRHFFSNAACMQSCASQTVTRWSSVNRSR